MGLVTRVWEEREVKGSQEMSPAAQAWRRAVCAVWGGWCEMGKIRGKLVFIFTKG